MLFSRIATAAATGQRSRLSSAACVHHNGDNGAGRGNRTLVFSLEGCCSTIELHPRKSNMSSPAAHWRMAGSPAGAQGAKAGGRGRTRTYEVVRQRIYSPPPLPLGTLSQT